MSDPLSLDSFESFDFEWGPWTRPVFKKGEGPAVIVMHEMPGLHPLVVRFANRVVAQGMTVYMPSLFGDPGRPLSAGYAVKEMFKGVCIRREFSTWSTNRSSAIVDWLRALARDAHEACGGAGVGAVGMCFTGGFALAMMTEPSVVAPVLSQPSLPLAIGPGKARRCAAIDASPEEIACARKRMEDEDLTMLGLRFKGDPLVPPERFEYLKSQFGDSFEAVELEAEDGREDPSMAPHSVLTVHLNDDDPEGPTRQVERQVLGFFSYRLRD